MLVAEAESGEVDSDAPWTSAGVSLAHISFAGGARLRDRPLRHDIVVIDDFWHDANQLRRTALDGTFTHRCSDSGFVFHDWLAGRRHADRVADLVSRACGADLLQVRYESRFVFETESDEHATRGKVWVHYDRWARVGVLYLSPPRGARGGTGFYRHKLTGFTSVHQADESGNRGLLMEHSTHLLQWECIAAVPIRFNRMVLFSPHIFHQALCYFGKQADDARLYNIVAFDNPK